MYDGLAGLIGLGVRGNAQEHGLATLHEFEALGANCCLRALTADETLDGAVHEHERLIAGLCGGWLLGKNDAGVHERNSIGSKPLCPLVQRPRRHGVIVTRLPCLRESGCPESRARRSTE